jgi:hypothetical protein
MLRLSYLRPNDLRLNTPQAGNARGRMNKNEKVMAVHNSNL